MPMRSSWRWASLNSDRSSSRSIRAMAASTPLLPRVWAPRATFSSSVMSGIIFTCWKVRASPQRAMARAGRPLTVRPRKVTAPRVSGSTPVIRLKVVVLPAPLGPIRPTISPALIWKLTSLTATRPPNALRTVLHVQHQLAGRRLVVLGQRRRIGPVDRALSARQPALDEVPQPVGLVLEHHHQGDAEDDHFVAAAGADQARQQHLQLVVQQLGQRRAGDRAPDMADAAHHRHEQVLDAHLQAEGGGVHGALEMRHQPAGHRGEQRGDHEDRDLVAEGADAHRFGHRGAALERADGAAGTRVQQVQQRHREGQHQRPGQHEEPAALADVESEQAQAADAQDAVVFAQRIDVAHQVIERQPPGDGGQRQVMARHAQGDEGQHQRAGAGDRRGRPRA